MVETLLQEKSNFTSGSLARSVGRRWVSIRAPDPTGVCWSATILSILLSPPLQLGAHSMKGPTSPAEAAVVSLQRPTASQMSGVFVELYIVFSLCWLVRIPSRPAQRQCQRYFNCLDAGACFTCVHEAGHRGGHLKLASNTFKHCSPLWWLYKLFSAPQCDLLTFL